MKSNKIIVAVFLSISFSIQGQAQSTVGVTHSGQSTGQTPFPVDTYAELPNPATTDPALWKNVKGTSVSWGSTDIRYKKEEPAPVGRISKEIELTAWKGERVASQWVVWGDQPLHSLSFSVTELVHKNKKSKIGQDRLLSGFVRYVMTDELNKDGMGGCGSRPDAAAFDSSLVADPIDHLTKVLSLPERTTQGGWVRVWVPQDSPAGIYEGKVILKDGDKTLGELILKINVKDRILPMPSEWTYHLDLWQNPFAIARYHQVEPWSKAHFDCMRPYMEMYRQAGGKVITASIMHKPWNGQTYDYFETMITWMKKADGSWSFDYTVFDRWIEFMMSVGVTQEINCYSMVPWRLSFQYFDQATNSLKFIDMKPGDLEYEDIWGTMLRSFAAHLKEKGWFDIIHISMDERPMAVMQETLKVIHKADPDFKVSLAGALHEELSDELDDYCVALRMKYSEEIKAKRRAEGKVTTFYTSCEEPRPNTFTFNPPAECEWFSWYAAKENLDGYSRWALNSWVIEPLLDSRFYTWPGGDTYFIYPGARTSMRFERLIAGIQAFEKIRILREEFNLSGNRQAKAKIDKALSLFDENTLETVPASVVISKANKIINSY